MTKKKRRRLKYPHSAQLPHESRATASEIKQRVSKRRRARIGYAAVHIRGSNRLCASNTYRYHCGQSLRSPSSAVECSAVPGQPRTPITHADVFQCDARGRRRGGRRRVGSVDVNQSTRASLGHLLVHNKLRQVRAWSDVKV